MGDTLLIAKLTLMVLHAVVAAKVPPAEIQWRFAGGEAVLTEQNFLDSLTRVQLPIEANVEISGVTAIVEIEDLSEVYRLLARRRATRYDSLLTKYQSVRPAGTVVQVTAGDRIMEVPSKVFLEWVRSVRVSGTWSGLGDPAPDAMADILASFTAAGD